VGSRGLSKNSELRLIRYRARCTSMLFEPRMFCRSALPCSERYSQMTPLRSRRRHSCSSPGKSIGAPCVGAPCLGTSRSLWATYYQGWGLDAPLEGTVDSA
jgi:hypothetical protein